MSHDEGISAQQPAGSFRTLSPPIIQVEGLGRTFTTPSGEVVAVDNLSFAVSPGEVYGLLGPNGAGKTTTLRMLLGLLRPTSGRAWLLGRPIGDPESRRRVGYLPENPYFF